MLILTDLEEDSSLSIDRRDGNRESQGGKPCMKSWKMLGFTTSDYTKISPFIKLLGFSSLLRG
jgi:hypothetical protein